MQKTGWIKLHRELMDNPTIMKDGDHLAIWTYLLLNASWGETTSIFGGKRITLNPGQLVTGRKKIASDLCVTDSKVQRVLKRYETEHQIEQQSSNQNRLITVVNWSKYQQTEHQTEHQSNINRTSTEHQLNTTEEGKKGRNKEYKRETFLSDDELGQFKPIWLDYLKHRREIKVKKYASHKSEKMGLSKLLRLSGNNPQVGQKIVDQSRENNYTGLFPLKEESVNSNQRPQGSIGYDKQTGLYIFKPPANNLDSDLYPLLEKGNNGTFHYYKKKGAIPVNYEQIKNQ